jgi:hypothetical protein
VWPRAVQWPPRPARPNVQYAEPDHRLVDNEQLNATTPSIHDVEQQAIARVELDQLRHAVADGIVSPRCWQALVATRLDPTDRITSGADRMAAMRAHRALTAWRDAAA